MLFGIGSGSPGPDVFFYNGKISWNSYDSDGNSFGAIPANANDGNWHHYVFVIDPGNTKLYYDGSLYGTATYVSAASGSLQIGGQSIYLWSGKIDDFRIYNRALSAQEVSNLYNSSGEALGILNRAHRDTLTSGLVGYWSFDGSQMSGNTATDGSGSGNSGTLTGGPTKTIGVLGQGVKFDGSDDYVTMGDAVALNGTQSRTISTWVKFSSDPLTTAQWLVERGNATNATYWLWWNGDNSFSLGDNTLVCGHRIANGTGEQIANTWTPVANMWYHVSCVYDGSQLIEYVNGVLLGSAGSATGSVTDETSSARTLQLGRRIATGGSNLNGILDDVRIYNRAISASEVSKLFISTGGRGSDVPYVVPADATAPVISNVQDTIGTHCVTATQTVSWATNEASNSQVEYGLTASYGTTTTLDSSLVTQHAVSISGLTLNTLYYYRVRSADAAGNVAYSASTMTTPGSLCGPD
jgi:hypothetical protein